MYNINLINFMRLGAPFGAPKDTLLLNTLCKLISSFLIDHIRYFYIYEFIIDINNWINIIINDKIY